MKIIYVPGCKPCPYAVINSDEHLNDIDYCNLSDKIISGTLDKPQEWCELPDKPPNKEVANVCSCTEPNPFVSECYGNRCRKCSGIIPEQR